MEMSRPQAEYFTYGDYAKWPDDDRWELIDGVAYALAPAPLLRHGLLLSALFSVLDRYFEGKPCQLLVAPVDVRLPKGDEKDEAIDTVVQPDLLVVCDSAKLDVKGVRGAPDLVIEILSESTMKRDYVEKLSLYQKHGVRCYLIADPWSLTLTMRYLEAGGGFGHPEIFAGNDRMPIRIFDGLVLDLARVFARLDGAEPASPAE